MPTTHVTVDERVVTGQNPASARLVGEKVVAELVKIKQTTSVYNK